MDDLKKALIEAGKEVLRILIISVVPVFITYLGGTDWEYALIAITILRAIEKFYYYWQKYNAEKLGAEINWRGIVGF